MLVILKGKSIFIYPAFQRIYLSMSLTCEGVIEINVDVDVGRNDPTLVKMTLNFLRDTFVFTI